MYLAADECVLKLHLITKKPQLVVSITFYIFKYLFISVKDWETKVGDLSYLP